MVNENSRVCQIKLLHLWSFVIFATSFERQRTNFGIYLQVAVSGEHTRVWCADCSKHDVFQSGTILNLKPHDRMARFMSITRVPELDEARYEKEYDGKQKAEEAIIKFTA